MLNAAPGLYARVRRAYWPNTSRGMWGARNLTASAFVATSRATTVTAVLQNTRPLETGADTPGGPTKPRRPELREPARALGLRRGRPRSKDGVDRRSKG